MGRTTSVCTITHVAKMLGENLELLEEISSNDDNLDYGDIVTIWTGEDETITPLPMTVSTACAPSSLT